MDILKVTIKVDRGESTFGMHITLGVKISYKCNGTRHFLIMMKSPCLSPLAL